MADRYLITEGFYAESGRSGYDQGPGRGATHQVWEVEPQPGPGRVRDNTGPRADGDRCKSDASNLSPELGLAISALGLVGTVASTYLAAAGLELATAATAATAAGAAVTAPYLAGAGAGSFRDAQATAAAIRRAVKDRVTASTIRDSDAAPELFSLGGDTDGFDDGYGDITDERTALVDNEEITSATTAPSVSAEQHGAVHHNPWAGQQDRAERAFNDAGPSGEPQKAAVGRVPPTTN